ncbi:GNAT family N-acetyltransferase [Nonomuraea sediminis]|uniref:GNAT family N-acetyltransferase n=1 Tax=Nonomuraea sediminis TaxID=2835864 RepID=UPI001BDD1FD0|nr:GNAT family N-acetyltransferase [Nonomuraea sediminis]
MRLPEGMRIHPIDFDSPADLMAGLFDAFTEAHAEIPGPPETEQHLTYALRNPEPGARLEGYAWVDGGRVVAAYAQSFVQRDNPHLTWLYPFFVRPDRRREGLGTLMLDHVKERARADGRTMVLTEAPVTGTGSAFGHARDFKVAVVEARRVLDLGRADWEELQRLMPEADSYRIELSEGPAGPELLEDLAALMYGMNDAPHAEGIEASTFDADLLREREESIVPRGSHCYTAVARRISDGAPAGYTRIHVDTDRSIGWGKQADTTVLRDHRGHRLGLMLKLANLFHFRDREPAAERIITWNATSNAHMLAINEAMGFELLDEWNEWQLTI